MIRPLICALTFALISATAFASVPGDPARGHALVERWCTSCHQVQPGGNATDVAPSFVTVANKAKDVTWVRGYLIDPHAPMVGLSLTRVEIDDIVAYLATLQQH